MTPWQFYYGGREWKIVFSYTRVGNTPVSTFARLYSRHSAVDRWQREMWEGAAFLHPLDKGKFSYAEGRKLAVQRLIREVPFDLRPLVAHAFFGRGGK